MHQCLDSSLQQADEDPDVQRVYLTGCVMSLVHHQDRGGWHAHQPLWDLSLYPWLTAPALFPLGDINCLGVCCNTKRNLPRLCEQNGCTLLDITATDSVCAFPPRFSIGLLINITGDIITDNLNQMHCFTHRQTSSQIDVHRSRYGGDAHSHITRSCGEAC
ncbi:hypothetical protein JOB18_017908 [Solea senegalensis]|uniref:Uncharacterized protein n=1 Tax=Solea senegalensis TaxID=28829 RepID=A0AAV6RAH2_SOLSE|nr:hypothetical protein JOB18_017908 [Solea senegalensis]